jgi:hypothetical protein
MSTFDKIFKAAQEFVVQKLGHISTEALGWMANIIIHASTVPTFIAVMMGLSDRMPSLDIILLVWGGLTLLFFRAVIAKDMLNVATIGFGFIIQATMMALIFFK